MKIKKIIFYRIVLYLIQMFLFILPITILSLLGAYMYYNSTKDMYVNNDINEYLLSSVDIEESILH